MKIFTITPKVGKPQLWFLCSAHCVMVVNISVKFRENISHGFQATRRKRFYDQITIYNVQRTITPNAGKSQLWFLYSARRLMVVNNSVKFR